MTTLSLNIKTDVSSLSHIPDDKLIRRFKIQNKGKLRDVNDPIPELKAVLKEWNGVITAYYVEQLNAHGIQDVAHAYLPDRSIKTNALSHTGSQIAQFDFKGFYDSCKFEYFESHLSVLDPSLSEQDRQSVKRLLIDPNTGGVTQGLPVSGALAGLTLIPFWCELKRALDGTNIRFTQYSDDLTFSYTGVRTPDRFTIKELTQTINDALKTTGLNFTLHPDKTRMQHSQFRKVTGVRINHQNLTTPAQKDVRFLKHALHILSKSNNLDNELKRWGFESKESFVGKVSYMRSIDSTGKINKIIMKYRQACIKHNLFTTWIDAQMKISPF